MSVTWSKDSIDFSFMGGWVLKAEADEENDVFHVTISNQNGDIVDAEGGEHVKETTVSFSLIREEDLIEEENVNE
jgi:hypothetical protein